MKAQGCFGRVFLLFGCLDFSDKTHTNTATFHVSLANYSCPQWGTRKRRSCPKCTAWIFIWRFIRHPDTYNVHATMILNLRMYDTVTLQCISSLFLAASAIHCKCTDNNFFACFTTVAQWLCCGAERRGILVTKPETLKKSPHFLSLHTLTSFAITSKGQEGVEICQQAGIWIQLQVEYFKISWQWTLLNLEGIRTKWDPLVWSTSYTELAVLKYITGTCQKLWRSL